MSVSVYTFFQRNKTFSLMIILLVKRVLSFTNTAQMVEE